MNPCLLEQLDTLTEETALELIMKQPALQVLQAIETMPDTIIEAGTDAIINYFKQYFNNTALSTFIDEELEKHRQAELK